MQAFKKIFFLLNANERRSACFLFLLILLMALIDMIGVASVLPFIAVLTNPNLIETNFILNFIFQASKAVGVENYQHFLFFFWFSCFNFISDLANFQSTYNLCTSAI